MRATLTKVPAGLLLLVFAGCRTVLLDAPASPMSDSASAADFREATDAIQPAELPPPADLATPDLHASGDGASLFDLRSVDIGAAGVGHCSIHNLYNNEPEFDDPDVGRGYAKQRVYDVSSLADVVAACTPAIYGRLLAQYCATGQRGLLQTRAVYFRASGRGDRDLWEHRLRLHQLRVNSVSLRPNDVPRMSESVATLLGAAPGCGSRVRKDERRRALPRKAGARWALIVSRGGR